MATANAYLTIDGAGNVLATFLEWAELISNMFSSQGWTRTADTGQTTLSTVTQANLPAVALFEIWQSNDALSSSFPMTVKVGYGSSSNGQSEPAFQITVGSGSNGSGTLLSASPTFIVTTNINSPANGALFQCSLSGAINRMTCLMFREWPGSFFFNIERSHDATGADTGEYFTLICGGSVIVYSQVSVFPAAQGVTFTETTVPTVNTTNTTGLILGDNTNLSAAPVWPVVGRFGNPLVGAVSVKGGDIASGALLPVSVYGTAMNYIVAKNLAGAGTIFRLGGGTALALLLN